jgi:aspartyl protease family protein
VNRVLLWFALIGCAGTLAVIAASQDQDAIGSLLRYDDLSSLGIKIISLVFVGGLTLALFRERLSRVLEAALFWAMVAILLAVGYTYRYDLQDVADRVLAELAPGFAATRGNRVEIVRTSTGEFSVTSHVNGARVPMVLDTGATAVVLTSEAAQAAGLPTGFLTYSVRIDTANGHTRAAPVVLDRLAVGGITERSVQALIAQPGQLKTSLLGMTFLNRLESWEVRGPKLVLRGRPNG